MKTLNNLIIFFLLGLYSFTTFSKTKEEPYEKIINHYITTGANNLNKIMQQNIINEQNGQADKNIYVFDFKDASFDPTSPIYVKNSTQTPYKNRFGRLDGVMSSVTIEEALNLKLQAINALLPTNKPKIYVAIDAYLGFMYAFDDVIQSNNNPEFTKYESIKPILRNKRESIETAYTQIFRGMEAFISLPSGNVGAEIIGLGFFEKHYLQDCDLDVNGNAIVTDLDAFYRLYFFKSFEYYNPTKTATHVREFDSNIRPTAFQNLPDPSTLKLSDNLLTTDPKFYDLENCVAYAEKLANNIKDGLMGNISIYNCADYPNSANVTITSITDPVNMANNLLRFREDCFKKLTFAERKYILTIAKNATGSNFNKFFDPVNYSDFGGANIACAIIKTTPLAEQKQLLDNLRDEKILMPILEKMVNSQIGDFCRELIKLSQVYYPFDGNFESLITTKKTYHWNNNFLNNAGVLFKGQLLGPKIIDPNNLTSQTTGYLGFYKDFSSELGGGAFRIQETTDFDPYKPIALISRENTLPYIDMAATKGYYIAAVPALYLFWTKRAVNAETAGKVVLLAASVASFYSGTSMIIAGRVLGMTGAVPTIVGGLEATTAVATITWEFTPLKANLKNYLVANRGYTDAEADAFGNNIETIINVANFISVGTAVADIAVNFTNAAKFWNNNRKVIVDGNVLPETTISNIDNLLKNSAHLAELSLLSKYSDLKFIYTGFQKSLGNKYVTFENALKACSDEVLSVLNQKPDLLFKLGAIDNVSEAILTERLTKIAKNNIDYGIFRLGTTNVIGEKNVILFSKIKNDASLRNLKAQFYNFSYDVKSKVMMDFKDLTESQLTILNDKNYLKQWNNLTGTGKNYVGTHINDLMEELTLRWMRKNGKTDQEIAKFLNKSIVPPKSYRGINWIDDVDEPIDYTNLTTRQKTFFDSVVDIILRNDDVSLIAQKMNIPRHIVEQVKQHFFVNEHLIFLNNKILKGGFTKDPLEVAIWKAAIDNGLTQDVRYFDLTLSEFVSFPKERANFLFKRLIAHEYIESKLMQKGYMYNSIIKGSNPDFTAVNFGGHELSINGGEVIEEFGHWNGANFAKKPTIVFGNDYSKLDLIVDEILNILE